jgi:hypothetical protein
VLQHPSSRHQQQQHAKQMLLHSRFAPLQDVLPAQQQQQQQQSEAGSFSKRHSWGFWPWSFLTQASWVGGPAVARSATQHSTPGAASKLGELLQQQPAGKSVEFAEPPKGAGTHAEGIAVATMRQPPQLLPPPSSAAGLQPLVGRAKAAVASARLEPAWLRPKAVRHFDPDACLKLLDDIELLLVR